MTMTYQAHDGHVARSEDLHRHILRSHLAYLNQEETPSKLEQRRNLESLISEFLCVVSHGAKFTFIEISNILSHSIENNPNFSAYKAASAFEALEKYATNLISHPWRKEYKTVKLYSGFYKHSVESQLIGGNSVLQLLGYQFTEEGVLFLDEPVDPDKAARVALDCLTAYVECQIMVQICERIKSYKCSWPEIHNVRQDYICGVDEAIRILHQLKRNAIEQDKQERWLRNQENGCKKDESFKPNSSSSYQKTGILVDVSNTWSSDNSYPPYEEESLMLQPSTISNPYLSKSAKGNVPIHSKLSSWSEGICSPLSDYQNQSLVSRSDETDSYAGRSFDDPIQMNYSFFNKSHNHIPRYLNSDLSPENMKDSWDLLQPSYSRRHDAYVNSDHMTGYNNTVPNTKESYTSHFGHPYPPPPQMMPLGLPSFSYHLPHDISIPLRQCQCRMCCERQFSSMSNKYQLPKDVGNNFDSNTRTSRIEANHDVDPSDICSSFLKLSLDDASSSVKSKPFPINSAAFSSYETTSDCLSDVVRSSNSKPVYHTPKRGSYYDNLPSPCDTEASCSVNMSGQSLNPKCDFQSNGITTCSASTLSIKPRSQKEPPSIDSIISNTLPTKQHKKNHHANSSLTLVRESSSKTDLDLKNTKPHPPLVQRDSKGSKKWSCTSCTFYNAAEKSICDMCGRSKLPGPEIMPLVSGGRECPQCTLVNKKDTEDCTACGASLKDSPTYI